MTISYKGPTISYITFKYFDTLGLTTAAISAADRNLSKNSWIRKTISNEEMEDMKIVKPLLLSCLLIKDASATNENEVM